MKLRDVKVGGPCRFGWPLVWSVKICNILVPVHGRTFKVCYAWSNYSYSYSKFCSSIIVIVYFKFKAFFIFISWSWIHCKYFICKLPNICPKIVKIWVILGLPPHTPLQYLYRPLNDYETVTALINNTSYNSKEIRYWYSVCHWWLLNMKWYSFFFYEWLALKSQVPWYVCLWK